jgi:hypothetical protein
VRWSVGIQAQGDRVMSREEVVELADAIAPYDGIATQAGLPAGPILRAEAISENEDEAPAR